MSQNITDLVDGMTGQQVRAALKAYLRAVERFDVRPEVPVLVKDLKAATDMCLHFGRHDVVDADVTEVAA